MTTFLLIISFVFASIILVILGKGQERYEKHQNEKNKEGDKD